MKKAISFSFMLLANIALLAHAVLPHHHHEDTDICFISSHCEAGEETHEHDNNSASEKCCFIDDVYTPVENNVKNTCNIHAKCNCGQVLYVLISNSLNICDFVDNTLIHFRHKPYAVTCHTDYISQLFGLRAPPVC